MSQFHLSTKHNPCAVCNDTKGKCRTSHDGNLVLCMNETQETSIPNFKFLGGTSNGLWGKWIVTDSNDDPEREQRRRRWQEREEQRILAEKARYSSGLSNEERGYAYKYLLSNLTLEEKHKEELERRRIPKAYWKHFKSIDLFTELPNDTSQALAGVMIGRGGVPIIGTNYARGMIIPCYDFDGNIVGYQLSRALNDDFVSGSPKYIWGKTSEKGDRKEITSHLQNGELPLNFRGTGKDKSTLLLVDSTFKPHIVHSRFGVDVVGAAGGLFLSSPQQTELITSQYQHSVIVPDAGDVINKSVIQRTTSLIKWLTLEKGKKVSIAWWGQVTKEARDIDELDELEYELISPREWGKIALEQGYENDLYDPNEPAPKQEEGETEGLGGYSFSEILYRLQAKLNKEKGIPTTAGHSYVYDREQEWIIPSDYEGQRSVEVVIPTKDIHKRAEIIDTYKSLGWKHILDASQTGSGKSHTVLDLHKALYLDLNYKNPSIEKLTDAPYLPPRTYYGVYSVDGKLVADPDEETRELAEDEDYPNVFKVKGGNCILKPAFRGLEAKGYEVEGNDSICSKCKFKKRCVLPPRNKGLAMPDEDFVSLFKYERQQAGKLIKTEEKGRLYPTQLSPEQYAEHFADYTLVWEESGSLDPIKDVFFTASELTSVLATISTYNLMYPEVAEAFPLSNEFVQWAVKSIQTIQKTLNPRHAIKHSESRTYHGLTDTELRRLIPPFELSPEDKISLSRLFALDMTKLIPDHSESIFGEEADDKEGRRQQAILHDLDYEQRRVQMEQDLLEIPQNGFTLLRALLDSDYRALLSLEQDELKNWVLRIAQLDDHHIRLASVAKANLYLSATIHIEQLASYYRIPDNEPILVIKQELTPLNNITAYNINTKGLGSNNWSKSAIQRIKGIIKGIKENLGEGKTVAIICPKKYIKDFQTPFYYGNHDRGSNELKNFDSIIYVGTPFIHVGQARTEYDLLHSGSKFTFDQFYQHRIQESRIQGAGRQRGQWRPNDALTQFYINSGENLTSLKDLGMTLVHREDDDFTDVNVCKTSFQRIKDAVSTLLREGFNVTQKAVADILGVSKPALSKALKAVFAGGWKAFIKAQIMLFNKCKENNLGTNPLEIRECDELMTTVKEDPLSIIEESLEAIESMGLKGYISYLATCCSYHTGVAIMWLLAPFFDTTMPSLKPKNT